MRVTGRIWLFHRKYLYPYGIGLWEGGGGGAKPGGCGYAFLRCTALRVSVVSVFCSVATSECSLFPRGDNALGLQFLGVSRIEDF